MPEPSSAKPRPFLALLQRDLLLSIRRSGETLLPLFFLFAVVILIPLGVGPGPNVLSLIAPGMVWVAALLSSLLALDQLFRSDLQDGTLEQWFVGHSSGWAQLLARLLSHWLVSAIPVITFSPFAAIMLHLPVDALPILVLTLIIGTPALSLIGSLAAALTLTTRGAGGLLPILVFPMVVPLLIFATGAVALAAEGHASSAHLGLLLAFTILNLTLMPLAIRAALRLNLE